MLSENCGALLVASVISGWRLRIKQIVIVVLAVNLVTHTIFWYTLPLLPGEALLRLLVYELVIVLVEGLAYAYFLHLRVWTTLLFSGFLNWLSYTLAVWFWQHML